MRKLNKLYFVLACFAVSFSFAEEALAQLQLADVPVACLPQRAQRNQMANCHCPPVRLCQNMDDMPLFLRLICCDTQVFSSSSSGGSSSSSSSSGSSGGSGSSSSSSSSSGGGICTQNGCPSGWNLINTLPVSGNNNVPIPVYYCDQQPDCSQIFNHLSAHPEIDIWERDPARGMPPRIAVQKTMQKITNLQNGTPYPTTEVTGWVCEAQNPGCHPKVQEWILPSIVQAVGAQNVCVLPVFDECNCPSVLAVSSDGSDYCSPREDCLPKDTVVITEDGKEKLIQDVKIGDRLKSQTRVNTVQEIQIGQTAERDLYSINNGKFTITEGHPFLTQSGWATVHAGTAAANAKKRNWTGHALRVGDRIIGVDSGTTVKNITPIRSKNAATYNLKLDGDNSFLANGVLVQGYSSVEINYSDDKEPKK